VSINTWHVKIILTGVHDSFWTHACDVDKLNIILREKFVELYSQPILENVSVICSNGSVYMACRRLLHELSLFFVPFLTVAGEL